LIGFGPDVTLSSVGGVASGISTCLVFAFALILGGVRRANSSSSEDISITGADTVKSLLYRFRFGEAEVAAMEEIGSDAIGLDLTRECNFVRSAILDTVVICMSGKGSE
jgi:hypothetical protein